MTEARLQALRRIAGHLEVLTGLRIGGANEQMEISGIDMPIIRNPLTREPYIPGSSLKGKMRSLVEWYEGCISADGGVFRDDPNHPICKVFGVSPEANRPASAYTGPTRLVVRDACLCEKDSARFRNGEPIVEVKTENTINRLKGAAEHPRSLERVIPGACFYVELIFRVLHPEDEGLFDSIVLKALALVESDCLGGCGSRGCGKVKFHLKDESGNPIALPKLDFTTTQAQTP